MEILTKNSLVQRDLDVISEIDEVEVGLTITSWNDDARKVFEPGASSTQKRIEALMLFRDAGIPTYAFLGPLLPYISEEDIESLIDELAGTVNRVLVDRLNIKAGNWQSIQTALEDSYPELTDKFKEASREESPYYDELRGKMRLMLEKRKIPFDIVF